MKHMKSLLVFLTLAVLLVGCGKTEPAADNTVAVQTDAAVPVEEITEEPTETTMPAVDVNEALPNVWDIMDNECVEEIELLRGLEVNDIDRWQKSSDFKEIKLYQRTIHESLRLGTIGDVVVAQFATNPDVYQTNYDYSADPVWNVRMEKSDGLRNNTGIEIPEDAWYNEYTVNRPKGETTKVICYDWPIEGDPEDTTAPVRTVELYLVYFEDTQNLYSIYTNESVYKWQGGYWFSNINRSPDVVLSYIKADGPNYYKHITDYDLKHSRGDVRYFRIKMLGNNQTYQYEVGMTMADWVRSKYNTDGWRFDSKEPFVVISADGKYKLSENEFCYGELTAQRHSAK